MTLPPVLDVETAAQLLRCEPSTVRDYARAVEAAVLERMGVQR